MKRSELKALLQERSDGYWELLATAAGCEASVEKTMAGLSAGALAANTDGPAVSPSVVEQRVQALAAHDVRLLALLVRDWKPADALSSDPFDEERDFWASAWCASLRFLKHQSRVPPFVAPSMPREVRMEWTVLFEGGARQVSTWEALLELVRAPSAGYGALRALDAATVSLPEPVSRSQLSELLGIKHAALGELDPLRVLCGRTEILSAPARAHLQEMLLEKWASREQSRTLGGLAILMEVVLEAALENQLWSDLADELVAKLRRIGEPGAWTQFTYLLLGTGWRNP